MSEERYKKPDATFSRERRGLPEPTIPNGSGITKATFGSGRPTLPSDKDTHTFGERFTDLLGDLNELCELYAHEVPHAIELHPETIKHIMSDMDATLRYAAPPAPGHGTVITTLLGVYLKPYV